MKWIFNASPCRIYPLFLQDRITLNTMPRENRFNTNCTYRLHFVIQCIMYLFSCLWTHEPLLSHILIRMETPWLITVHMCSFSNKLRKSSQQVECVCTLRSCNTGQQTPLHVWNKISIDDITCALQSSEHSIIKWQWINFFLRCLISNNKVNTVIDKTWS